MALTVTLDGQSDPDSRRRNTSAVAVYVDGLPDAESGTSPKTIVNGAVNAAPFSRSY
jgi:hypothetical protein